MNDIDKNTPQKTAVSFSASFHSDELNELDLPVEVRQLDLRRVDQSTLKRGVSLLPGEYIILLHLPAGQILQSHVEVKEGQKINVNFAPDESDASPNEFQEVQHFLRQTVRPKIEQALAEGLKLADGLNLSGHLASIVKSFSANNQQIEPVSTYRLRWFTGNMLSESQLLSSSPIKNVDPIPQKIDIPSEVIRLNRPFICQFLQSAIAPLNLVIPWSSGETGRPEITLLPPRGKKAASIAVRLGNVTVDLLARYSRRGMLREATETLQSNALYAERLLEAKRADPIAATVGAFVLLRIGDFGRLHDWTTNLLNLFEWLPDGAAILGEHLAQVGKHGEALKAFLRLAERGTPLFTEGLSFALDRLQLYTSAAGAESALPPQDVDRARSLLTRLRPFALHGSAERTTLAYTGLDPTSPNSERLKSIEKIEFDTRI